MTSTWSLRARLTLIILLPVMVVGLIAGFWQLRNAQATAEDVFNHSLLSAVLAVANDVTVSGGDALSARTRDILADTSGGPVFYHVYAPDGVIVAGYATPPVGIPSTPTALEGPIYFDAIYLGREVSGVRLQARSEIAGFAGIFTTTVWQDRAVRGAFVRALVLRTTVTICALLLALGLIVWFGVSLGLRPLLDLEEALGRRSSDELSPLRRPVPSEVAGIVARLNGLFGQVSRSMTAQTEFISNAAHQLRNPIAGVLSLAEAVDRAPNAQAAKERTRDLLAAARETADLSNKLLILERAKAQESGQAHEALDLHALLTQWAEDLSQSVPSSVTFRSDIRPDLRPSAGDPTMLRETLRNLVDNALSHGGPDVSQIRLRAWQAGGQAQISVEDNGQGLPEDQREAAFERFRPLAASSGSGLGLSIARAVAEAHGGAIWLEDAAPGLRVTLSLPSV